MARELGSNLALPCEVTDDAQIASLFHELGKTWKNLDGLVHAIAFAPREAIAGDFLEATSSKASAARRSARRTTSRPTASPRSPRARCPYCTGILPS
jgi:enoyl-[acyl-carrier-protein] reductase (NADH)